MRAFRLRLLVVAIFLLLSNDCWAQLTKSTAEVRFNLLTLPGTRIVQERLNAPAQMHYERSPLRDIVAQIQQRYGVLCWIDRRIDADKPLTLSMPNATLGECLSALAKLCDADAGLIENVITIAPSEKLAAMQYTAIRFHDLLSRNSTGDKSAQLRPLSWSKLTTPSEWLEQVAMAWGFQLNAELPHDLMNEGQLPPCTLATQLTLLLGGFDRCAVGSDASRLRIAKLPAASDWQAIYDESSISPKNLTAMAAEFPQARLENQRKQVTLTGSTAAHLRLLRPVVSERSASRPSPRNNGGERDPLQTQNYTIMLKQPQPIRSVLAAFVKQSGLGLEVRWDKSLSELQMQAQVTLDVKNAKLDQVLETLATQSQLTIVRTGKAIDVRPIVKEGAGK